MRHGHTTGLTKEYKDAAAATPVIVVGNIEVAVLDLRWATGQEVIRWMLFTSTSLKRWTLAIAQRGDSRLIVRPRTEQIEGQGLTRMSNRKQILDRRQSGLSHDGT
ncbi:uncharacterized protein MELLADRAFT_113263 [Melampsora larici-populina 98AG31]|uniref:Uncharacterized protein n=1 Tax=Melampsora larici-populina (strain 98AG31 / pathotype 3-4-7) TaxID=747676 RepID=F4S9A4_MELLP|nr:uncharacterized protein MELLADRAFT_113263 [Melampsora larici-populina 98AG31]EGF98799.1 hypothetical protein MELLADRAFT_113263 [Melampsora larici-populina 98AG31]